ncbi:hypothetical protein [Telluribacter humicola]|uniref:hypothetical protein n=1 Tax=Telluribacter humicola TaxID=1720261 RepID=UPI001A979B5A|nr:hypothetical protein [Telluribacter humicola]
MKNLYLLLILLFVATQARAQTSDSLNQNVSPKGGLNALALHYYRIDFTKEQRQRLKDVELEFIYQIDESGALALEEVNGINDKDIVDSLKNRTLTLPRFSPQVVNGTPQPSLYFMKLTFPSYQMTNSRLAMIQPYLYNEAKLDDFEYIKKSNQRMEVLFGGVYNQFLGNPSLYLRPGGGMKVDVTYTAKNLLMYGLTMSIYGNKFKQVYPIYVNRNQFPAPPTAVIGLVFGKWFNKVNAQLELGTAVQNITENKGGNDPDWVQLTGWSPGLVVNYPIKLGKDKIFYNYGAPSIFNHNLNLHVGVRQLFLSLKEATGGMFELGLSYRMSYEMIEEFRLKQKFLDRLK